MVFFFGAFSIDFLSHHYDPERSFTANCQVIGILFIFDLMEDEPNGLADVVMVGG